MSNAQEVIEGLCRIVTEALNLIEDEQRRDEPRAPRRADAEDEVRGDAADHFAASAASSARVRRRISRK